MNEKIREKEGSSFPAVTGASSLLVIFSVLCLTVFSLLSLSTVSADHRIAEENFKAVESYYEADYEANRILASLRAGEMPDGVSVDEEGTCSYNCSISDTQILVVEVSINGSEYEIQRWQAVSTYEWQPDTALPVWQAD